MPVNRNKLSRKKTSNSGGNSKINEEIKMIEHFADLLSSTSPKMMSCKKHEKFQLECAECVMLWEKVKKYQCHHDTHNCSKKRKCITIKENEGHGRFDGL